MYKDEHSKKFITEFEIVRIKEKISQRKLSLLIGMAPQTITQIKNGKQSVQADVLKKFSEMFGYDFNFFFSEKGYKKDNDLKEQFDLIKKNNEMLIQLFQTGIELTNS